MQLLSIILF